MLRSSYFQIMLLANLDYKCMSTTQLFKFQMSKIVVLVLIRTVLCIVQNVNCGVW